jgi:hypothetical protein|tara:strand:- start:8 stop:232 length:225 start_codon:yes stop_codon:yes gene_type:complete
MNPEYLKHKPLPRLNIGDLVDVLYEGLGLITSHPWISADCDLDECDVYYLVKVNFPHGQFAVDTDDLTVLNESR